MKKVHVLTKQTKYGMFPEKFTQYPDSRPPNLLRLSSWILGSHGHMVGQKADDGSNQMESTSLHGLSLKTKIKYKVIITKLSI